VPGPDDLLEQMRDHKVGWRFSDVERILDHHGFVARNQRGSDRVYKHEATGVRYFISWHGSGSVKPGYIKELVRRIDEVTAKST
jgi:predicted RNA binding protein YcfA (HicA-like mRNA interferase family)